MSSKQSKHLVNTTGSSAHRPTATRRRRRISARKTSSDQNHSNAIGSPEIKLKQLSPTQSKLQWPPFEQEIQEETPSDSADEVVASRPSPSRSLSSSASSSTSEFPTEDSDSNPSPIRSLVQETPQILSPIPTTAQIHPLVASLRSSHSRSPNRIPKSPTPPYLSNFAPPFYNRPPANLLASPSLTSLLRPAFSRPTSRPTTPDESEPDPFLSPPTTPFPGISTPDTSTAHLLNTAQAANPLPRASPKVPTYEYYGFALYVTSSVAFVGYVLWSYLPSTVLHWLGIYYYPDRWWSLAIPAWIVMAVMFVYVALATYNSEVLTLPLGSLGAIVDEVGVVAVVDQNGELVGKGRRYDVGERVGDWRWRDAWSHSTDAVLDVPIGGVCEVLYGDG
ncbi:MAG: hypothetical protein GOMPHAMPRED_004512 [Gomphillus americanus]|uniref:PIG-P domain-containing protein n=1 Tax=Gomphillus americanus TaxID=1940652 RepID=A0A8H3FR17_9LECA|nr:MAG: hypothetical protein GOMPHAMPRED_004512 [Gomphillus americanus]